MRRKLLIFLILCMPILATAQAGAIDSLTMLLEAHPQRDSARIQLLAKLGYASYSVEPEQTEACGQEILDIAEELDYTRAMATGHQMLGIAYSVRASYPEALEQYLIAMSIQRRLKDKRGEAQNLNNIAGLFFYQNNLEKALHYNQRSLEINRELNDSIAIAHAYLSRGMMQSQMEQDDEALASYKDAVALYSQLGDQRQLANAYTEIGSSYTKRNRPLVALQYFRLSLDIKRSQGDIAGISITMLQLGASYIAARQYGAAQRTLQEGLKLAEESDATQSIIAYHLKLAELDSLRGNYQQSLENYTRYIGLKDSLFNEQRNSQFLEMQARLEETQTQQELEILKRQKALDQAELAISQATIQNQRLMVMGGMIGLGLLGAVVVILYQLNQTRKAANQQLEKQKAEIQVQKEQLETLNRTKDQWFSILGNDFRYPLHFLQHALALINEGNLNERERSMLTSELEQRARNTGNLLDNLLYWAQDQTEDIPFSAGWINVHDLVQESVVALEHRAEKKGIVIANKVPKATRIWADEDTTRLALRNLMDNALKFSFRGDVVRILADETPDSVAISIQDQGIGISEEARNRLFKPGAPYSTIGTARERGTGMGLLLTQDMVHRNEGRIVFESVPGQGSTFTLIMPRKEQPITQEQAVEVEQAQEEN